MIDLTEILAALATLVISAAGLFLIPYIKAEIGEKRFENLQIWVETAVCAAEQIFDETDMGAEKKEYVLNFLASRGFKIDFDELDALIESAVYGLKTQN